MIGGAAAPRARTARQGNRREGSRFGAAAMRAGGARQVARLAAGQGFELIPGPREVGISELFRAKTGGINKSRA